MAGLTLTVEGPGRLVITYRVQDGVHQGGGDGDSERMGHRRRTVFSHDPARQRWTRRDERVRDGRWCIVGVEQIAAPYVRLALDGAGRGSHTITGP